MTDWRLRQYESLPSTSDLCRTLAAAGEPDGLAVLARRQTAGRGSRGRLWDSPSGNLALSVLLRPSGLAAETGQWSLLAGVALAEALAPLLPDPRALSVKWPNDVLLRGRKLGGILVESAADGEGGLAWLVIGLGANLVEAPDIEGRSITSLTTEAVTAAPEVVAHAVLARLDHWRRERTLHGFAPIRAAWLARAPELGSHVLFRSGNQEIGGGFAGLGEDGSLLLQSGGRVRAFSAGEVLQLG